MSVRSTLGAARRKVLCSLYRRSVPLGEIGPVVSFTFDDFPRTAYSIGGAILEGCAVRGTYYAAAGLMNSANDSGDQFGTADVEALLDKGHELASHTFSHISCHSVSTGDYLADVRKGRRSVEQLAGLDSPNFAYPFGAVTVNCKRALQYDLGSARSIFPGFNGPEVDLNLLRANRLYGDRNAAASAEKLISENVWRKAWLIFYTHDVRPEPSPYGCTPTLLEAVVSLAARSGSRILTVRETLAEMGIQNGTLKGQVPCEV